MSILELPVELLIKILSYLECNDLRQIRYASKIFHVIIENNIHLMNKFEIHELTIISTHREKQEEKFDVEFSTYNGFNPIKEKRIKIKNIYSSCLHYYLTRCDINYLESISITVEGVNELFDVINQFITSKTPIKNINISVSKTPTPHSIETFITNTQNIEYLRINKLNFYPSISTITFPTFEKLRVLEIYDYFDNEQYIKEVVTHFLVTSPRIYHFVFKTKLEPSKMDIIDLIINKKLNNTSSCNYGNHVFSLILHSTNGIKSQSKDDILYNITSTQSRTFNTWCLRSNNIIADKPCGRCDQKRYLNIFIY